MSRHRTNAGQKPMIVTGLDVGSSKIAAVAVEIRPEAFTVLAQASFPSEGISRGVITDMNGAVSSTSKVLGKIKERLTSKALEHLYVNVGNETLRAEYSKGMIPLSMRGREVTRGDISRCINVASTIQLPFEREILHKIVHAFAIDDQPSIKNPLGLYASRLACEMYVVTADINHIQNIYKCVNDAGYNIEEIVFTGMADAAAALTSQEKEAGAIMLDMGACLTQMSLFAGGVLRDIEIIPLGAQDIKGEMREDPALKAILSRVNAKKEELRKKGTAMESFTLTGGLAFVDGMIELLEEKLLQPVKIAIARDVRGEISSVDSIRLTTAIGLARYAEEKYRSTMLHDRNILESMTARIVDLFNNYF